MRLIHQARMTDQQATIAVVFDYKNAFHSFDLSVVFGTLIQKSVTIVYVNILHALYSNTTARFRVYGELPDVYVNK